MKTVLFLFSLFTVIPTTYADNIIVANFSNNDLSGWQEKVFSGRTTYSLNKIDELSVLTAHSSMSASGLFKTINIDLNATPIMHWSWNIKHTLTSDNERTKSGDDFSARIYVVFSDGPFFWQTKTLNYVWANQAKVGEYWSNPYTENARMFAIQAGDKKTNRWHMENRNVLKDIQQVFGITITRIDAIAIMTDTDQTGAATQALFGDIWFSN